MSRDPLRTPIRNEACARDRGVGRKRVVEGSICAIVVTHNRMRLLRECLLGLRAQTRRPDGTLVVDNASTDGTRDMLMDEFPEVEVLSLPENRGGAGGFFHGIKHAYEAGYDWMWVMDDDAEPRPAALERLFVPEAQAPDVCVVASTVVSTDGATCHGHRRFFNRLTGQERAAPTSSYRQRVFEVDTVSFVGSLISRRAIAKHGYPMPDLVLFYDDTEYSLRLRDGGQRILVVPTSIVIHKGEGAHRRGSPAGDLSWRDYYSIRNGLYTRLRYGRIRGVVLAVALTHLMKTQLRILLRGRHRVDSTRTLWRAVMHGLCGRLGRDPGAGGGA